MPTLSEEAAGQSRGVGYRPEPTPSASVPCRRDEVARRHAGAVDRRSGRVCNHAQQEDRDLAGWVVYLLRQCRDHGWTPTPPTPRPDAPQVLGAYFAQLATERAVGRAREQTHDPAPVKQPPELTSTAARATPPLEAAQPPSLAELWQNALATLRLRLPREMYQACVRQAELVDTTGDTVTIGVTDLHTEDKLQFEYAGPLRLALRDTLGHDVAVRVVLRMPA
jgi:hypothetical protein